MLAYNCSPSFNWKKKLDDATIARFQTELAAMGYKFQFITLAGFHALNLSMFELARGVQGVRNERLLAACRRRNSSSAEQYGYEAVKHQRFVGHRLLRHGDAGDRERKLFHHGAGRIDGDGAVCTGESMRPAAGSSPDHASVPIVFPEMERTGSYVRFSRPKSHFPGVPGGASGLFLGRRRARPDRPATQNRHPARISTVDNLFGR